MTRSAHVKRLTDVVLGTVLLVVFTPVMALIALAILMLDGRPVLFRQRRPGLRGKPFTCHKFRTMRAPKAGENMWTTDEARMTTLGRLLRKTSLDELPELAHVVTGRMSLVGPRPLLMEYLPKYSAYHRRRHEMRPGITGLAQVNGRRALSLSQRLDLDVKYVDNWSLGTDLLILLRTLAEPFRSGDIAGQTVADVDDLQFHKTGAGVRS
jgi:sugar transferase EpsL